MEKPTAVLDANVLFSAASRDFLMHLAYTSFLFQPIWSDQIFAEWIENAIKKRNVKRSSLNSAALAMNQAFPDAKVDIDSYQDLIPSLELPDQDDRHVLATGIVAKANFIVTLNLKDFPDKTLQKYRIEAVSPDEFALSLISNDIDGGVLAVKKQSQNLKNPPLSPLDVLKSLGKKGYKVTSEFLVDLI